MAKVDVIEMAVSGLVKALEEADFSVETLMEVGGDETPLSVLMLRRGHRSVSEAAYALFKVIREDALPYLADLDRAGNGGMGAVAPMVTKVMAGQSATSRT